MTLPNYRTVLVEARALRDTHQNENLKEAKRKLLRGMEEFDDALPIGEELVLVLRELGEIEEAIRLLKQLESDFPHLNDEILCRWGSFFKKDGEKLIAEQAWGQASSAFEEAEQRYERAFEIHPTHYPKVNQLTARLVRASLLAEIDTDRSRTAEIGRMVEQIRLDATALINDASLWLPVKPDDAIWIPASRGEARLLAQDWPLAATAYEQALTAAKDVAFARGVIAKQVKMLLLPAFRRLGIPVTGSIADPDTFFAE